MISILLCFQLFISSFLHGDLRVKDYQAIMMWPAFTRWGGSQGEAAGSRVNYLV